MDKYEIGRAVRVLEAALEKIHELEAQGIGARDLEIIPRLEGMITDIQGHYDLVICGNCPLCGA